MMKSYITTLNLLDQMCVARIDIAKNFATLLNTLNNHNPEAAQAARM